MGIAGKPSNNRFDCWPTAWAAADVHIERLLGTRHQDRADLGLDIPAQGTIYQPLRQLRWWEQILFVRTTGDPVSFLPAVRIIVRDLDPAPPLSSVATMDELMQEALDSPRSTLV